MSSLFSGPPKAPTIPAPIVMPTENTQAVAAAQQAQAAAASNASGRLSTILSLNKQGTSDTLG